MTPEQKTYECIIAKVAGEQNLPISVVDKTYKAYWKFVRASIEKLPLMGELSEAEYGQLRTSINIPSLGKFYCDYGRYKGIKNRYEQIKKLRENGN